MQWELEFPDTTNEAEFHGILSRFQKLKFIKHSKASCAGANNSIYITLPNPLLINMADRFFADLCQQYVSAPTITKEDEATFGEPIPSPVSMSCQRKLARQEVYKNFILYRTSAGKLQKNLNSIHCTIQQLL